MKGLVGGSAQNSTNCLRNWTTALIPRSSGIGTHPTSAECAEAARIASGRGRCKMARSAMREQSWNKTSIALFRVLDILTNKWARRDLPEECRCLLNTHLTFLTRPRSSSLTTSGSVH